MERKVKVGDRIKIIKPWMTQGRYEKGDVLTVRSVGVAGVWVVENDRYIDRNEFEVITDEIKPGDTVTLIDKPWEWDGWANLPRKRRLIYKGFMGKENEVICVYNRSQVSIAELQGHVCANIGCYYVIPLAILRKAEPVKVPFDVEPEPVKPTKHRYTDEKITEAKMIIGRLVADLEQATDLAFIEDGNLTKLYIDGRKVSEAKCSPQDEPNRAIGRMVAMLKRLDEPLPTWIREVEHESKRTDGAVRGN